MSAAFVIDSSVSLAWCFDDEATVDTDALLALLAKESAVVPAWWYIEMTNVLALAERKGRIKAVQVAEFIAMIGTLDLEVDDEAPGRAFDALLGLCRTHQLTAYDAVYLDLAIRRQLPLATLDKGLRKAAQKAGVPLLGK